MSTWDITYNVILLTLAVLISISNLVVVVTILKTRSLHVPSNVFVASMALADASTGLIGLPFRFVASLEVECSYEVCFFYVMIYLYFGDVSVLTLVGFTLDRLYAIRFPFKYHNRVDCKFTIIESIIFWIATLFLTFVPSWIMDDGLRLEYQGTCGLFAIVSMPYLADYRFFEIFIFTLSVLISVNVYIMCVVQRHRDTIRRLSGSNNAYKREYRAELLVISMIGAFIVCRLPLNVANLVNHHLDMSVGDWRPLLLIYYSNYLLNPFIYAYNNKKIYREIKTLIMFRTMENDWSLAEPSDLQHKKTSIRSSRHNSIPIGDSCIEPSSTKLVACEDSSIEPSAKELATYDASSIEPSAKELVTCVATWPEATWSAQDVSKSDSVSASASASGSVISVAYLGLSGPGTEPGTGDLVSDT